MKIMRKIMIVFMILSCMMINVNAEILAPAMNSPTRIAILGKADKTEVLRTYGPDGNAGVYVGSDYPCPGYGIWLSNVYADTIYKLTLYCDQTMLDIGETGFMEHADDYAAYLIPAEYMLTGLDLSPSMYGVNQWIRTPWESLETYRLPDNQYEIFWDKTLKQLSCIFFNKEVSTNAYILIRLGTWTQTGSFSFRITDEITKGPQGIYTEILQDIKQLLEESSDSGGSLTSDMIDEAIVKALDQHDQQLQSDVQQQGTQADQLVDQLGNLVPSVKLQTALQGLTAAVSGNHRTCNLVLPELIEPVTGAMIMEETSIDLTGTLQGIINGDSRIATLVDLVRWINLLVLAFYLLRSIMNIINYVTSGGDSDE